MKNLGQESLFAPGHVLEDDMHLSSFIIAQKEGNDVYAIVKTANATPGTD